MIYEIARAVVSVWVAAFVGVAAVTVLLDFGARVARYQRYRRSYPAAARSDVWRHVRVRRR